MDWNGNYKWDSGDKKIKFGSSVSTFLVAGIWNNEDTMAKGKTNEQNQSYATVICPSANNPMTSAGVGSLINIPEIFTGLKF